MRGALKQAIPLVLVAVIGLVLALLLPGRSVALAVVGAIIVAYAVTHFGRRRRWTRTPDSEFLQAALLRGLPSAEVLRIRATLASLLGQPVETIAADATLESLVRRDAWFGTEGMALDDVREHLGELGVVDLALTESVAEVIGRVLRQRREQQ